MKFDFTPEEAQKTATIIAKHLGKTMKVHAERSYSKTAPYCTTLMAEANGLTILIDTQGAVDYHRQLRDLRNWIFAERAYVELHVATSPQGGLITGVLQEMKDNGVGLMTVGADNKIIELAKARNPALIISPDPTLKYGKCKNEVLESLEKFNNVNRKDGLRDMCELVERDRGVGAAWRTEKLAYDERCGHRKHELGDPDKRACLTKSTFSRRLTHDRSRSER